MHLSGKAGPKSSPRFSMDTIIAFHSAAGHAFATEDWSMRLLSLITEHSREAQEEIENVKELQVGNCILQMPLSSVRREDENAN
jgi:hypothetical protein